jgi:hypothetical protein
MKAKRRLQINCERNVEGKKEERNKKRRSKAEKHKDVK